MRTVLFAVLLAVLLPVDGQSQPPVPGPSEGQGSQPNTKSEAAERQPDVLIGSESAPAVVRIAKSQEETAQEQTDRDDEAAARRWTIGLTFAIAAFTFALVYVGWKQRQTYEAALAANKVIERAYVKMSHNRPGLIISDWAQESASGMTHGDGVRRQNISVNVKVKNDGNTPATVTYHSLHLFISNQPLPTTVPPYDPRHAVVVRVSLVKGDSFNIFGNFPVESTAIERIRHGHDLKLYLLGYVDYVDRFSRRHRAGYARVYNPAEDAVAALAAIENKNKARAATRNNLPFVTQPGYNYDRERKQGEGNDWNNPE